MQRRYRMAAMIFWIAAIAWAGMLFFFSGQDGVTSGELSRAVAQLLMHIFPKITLDFETVHFLLRKISHFCIFALEGFLLGMAVMLSLRRVWRSAAAAALMCAVMAMLNEYHQSFSVGRSCEVRDMLIDAAGSTAGVLFALLVLWILRRCFRSRNVIIS